MTCPILPYFEMPLESVIELHHAKKYVLWYKLQTHFPKVESWSLNA